MQRLTTLPTPLPLPNQPTNQPTNADIAQHPTPTQHTLCCVRWGVKVKTHTDWQLEGKHTKNMYVCLCQPRQQSPLPPPFLMMMMMMMPMIVVAGWLGGCCTINVCVMYTECVCIALMVFAWKREGSYLENKNCSRVLARNYSQSFQIQMKTVIQ